MKKNFIKYLFSFHTAVLAMMLMPFAVTYAAEPEVHARLSADTIMIGDHFYLEVEIKKDMVQVVEFPDLGKSMMDGSIELLEELPADTISVEGRIQKLLKRYRMICFDEGIYHIDSFPLLYVDKNIIDTLYARDKNTLFVDTYVVDTVKQTVYDIKKPLDAPLFISEVSGYIEYALLFITALIAAMYLIMHNMRKHPAATQDNKPREAPHVVAIRQLEQLNNQKIWQHNKHKLYYTRLTEILREYIDGRYGISAREMTSDEILDAVKEIDLSVKDHAYLERVLKDADLVKFAKHVPQAEQNETAYLEAYYFVENTKPATDNAPQSQEELQAETIVMNKDDNGKPNDNQKDEL